MDNNNLEISKIFVCIHVIHEQGCIVVWNIRSGRVLRTIALGEYNYSNFVNHIQKIDNSTIACSYGSEVYIISFSSVVEKND